jgi:hypothetical protein
MNNHFNSFQFAAAPTACAVVICVASFIGSANVLEFEHHREVCSVSGEVMLSQKRQRNLYLPDYRAAFAFSQFRYPHRHRSALRLHYPIGERDGLTLFR